MEEILTMSVEDSESYMTVTAVEGNDGTMQTPVEIVISEEAEGTLVYEVYHEVRDITGTEGSKIYTVKGIDESLAPSASIVSERLKNETENVDGDIKTESITNVENFCIRNCKKEDNVMIHTYQCSKCDVSYTEFNELKKHQRLEHSLKEFESIEKNGCPICESNYKPKPMGSRFKPFLCGICDKGYTSIRELKKHFSVHVKTNLFFCDSCEALFQNDVDLKEHKKVIHLAEKKHKCPICDKSFRTISNVRSHSRVHSDNRPYLCQYCKKAFKSHSELKSHEYIHTNERPYHCETCGKNFRQSGNFHSHLRMHQNERNHVCEICGRAFIESSKLRRHMRIHSNEKPYECEICQKTFSDHSNKKAHFKTHMKNNKVVYYMLLEDGKQAQEIAPDVVQSLYENNEISQVNSFVNGQEILPTCDISDKLKLSNLELSS